MNSNVNGRYWLRSLACSVTRTFLQGRHEQFIPVHMASFGQISTFLCVVALSEWSSPISWSSGSFLGEEKSQRASGWRSNGGKRPNGRKGGSSLCGLAVSVSGSEM